MMMVRSSRTTLAGFLALVASLALALPGWAEDVAWPFPAVATTAAWALSDGWRFAQDPQDRGMDEAWFGQAYRRDEWREAAVPGVWGVAPGRVAVRITEGVGWYARPIRLPEKTDGEPSLVFLGAMYTADVWLGGEYLGTHNGGYTPFSFELAGKLAPGEEKTLVVRVDNRRSDQTIPGKNMGWNAYGGLTREVFLIVRPGLRVEELRTAATVGAEGPVRLVVSGRLANGTGQAYAGEVLVVLKEGNAGDEMRDDGLLPLPPLDGAGSTVAQAVEPVTLAAGETKPFRVEFVMAEARRWSPDDPFLHDLEISWQGEVSPRVRLPVGLREVRLAGPHFLLNGKRLWLQGFGQHEDLRDYGPCLPQAWYAQEAKRMKAFGTNHLRISHYPHHPAFFAACDRLGLLVFTEIPVWQLNREWIRTEQAWTDWAEPQLTEMIHWYGNFTSVISWGAANEMDHVQDYDRRAVEFMRKADPGRLPMIVTAATQSLHLYDLLPLAGRNLHYGWYHSPRVYDGLRKGLPINLKNAERVDTPIWVAELGAQGAPGRFTGGYNDESRGSETYLDKVVRFGFQYTATADERVAGIAIWTWSDFIRQGDLCSHGIFGYGREPKMIAYTVRNLYAGDLRVFLCEADADCRPGGEFRAQAFLFNPRLQAVPTGLRLRWKILHGATLAASGEMAVPTGEARALPTGEIVWPIPANLAGMHSLWVELVDAKGFMIHSNGVHFGVGEPVVLPGALFLTVTKKGVPVPATMEFAGVRLSVYDDPGLIIPLPEGEYPLTLRCGKATQSVTVRVAAGAATTVAVEMVP
jgi:hypothetical protein